VAQELSLTLPEFPRLADATIDDFAAVEPAEGPFARWPAFGRIQSAEIFAPPSSWDGQPVPARRLHHGCRRSCFWLITLPRTRSAFNGRSKKEDFALAPQHAAIASFFESRGLCRMPELRELKRPHHLCDPCGYYDGREVTHGAIGDRLARKPRC
jgi:hypothetical protein